MVFGRRSGPEESSVQGICCATGNDWALPKPPSFETSASDANDGQTAKTVTFGSFVNCAPSLIETPSCLPAGGVVETTSCPLATLLRPELSVTRTWTGSVAGVE